MFSQKAGTPEEKKPPPDAHAGPNADESSNLLTELSNSVNTKPQEENDHEAKSSDSSFWELADKSSSSCAELADEEKDAAAVGFTAGTAKEEEAAGDAVR